MLKGKIHRIVVTDVDLDYEASIKVDKKLLDAADIIEYEQVQIYNITNGERFTTYAIAGPEDHGKVCVNGAAARKVLEGDLLIIASYAEYEDSPNLKDYHNPKIITVGWSNIEKKNVIRKTNQDD